ncbi:hypothetical protein CC78DRAFT_582501 [Lojkania enalia]|uniref:Uncharacterized protein n=1 Tax=Lojkania enalia TaxID=147567 RepID=A0A9P4N2G6_9PLEO|nr:hypothetical protein CC78DRAFT_582501 [Didymosphaeria enalia]
MGSARPEFKIDPRPSNLEKRVSSAKGDQSERLATHRPLALSSTSVGGGRVSYRGTGVSTPESCRRLQVSKLAGLYAIAHRALIGHKGDDYAEMQHTPMISNWRIGTSEKEKIGEREPSDAPLDAPLLFRNIYVNLRQKHALEPFQRLHLPLQPYYRAQWVAGSSGWQGD